MTSLPHLCRASVGHCFHLPNNILHSFEGLKSLSLFISQKPAVFQYVFLISSSFLTSNQSFCFYLGSNWPTWLEVWDLELVVKLSSYKCVAKCTSVVGGGGCLCKIVHFSLTQPSIKFSSLEMARYFLLVLYVIFGPIYVANNAFWPLKTSLSLPKWEEYNSILEHCLCTTHGQNYS